ncbi:hypothetical protein ACFX13_022289 [Malus domestica]
MLPKEAQAWLDEFMDHIGSKNEDLPEPNNFHVNVIPLKHMKKLGKSEEDLILTDLTVSIFFGAITKTHGILLLEVDLGSKQIMLAFFVVDSSYTCGALLGRDWIHQSISIPSTLHQQIAVYHKEDTLGLGFWEMVKAESRQFLPTANVAEAIFYNLKVMAQKLVEQRLFLTREE